MKRTLIGITSFIALFSVALVAQAMGIDLSALPAADVSSGVLGGMGFVGMAKVTGPLMSMDASGSFGGAMVHGNRLGTHVVRALVTPANPMSALQQAARNIVRVAGAGQRYANLDVNLGSGRIITDKATLTAAAPAGQTWNGYLVKLITGIGQVNYLAATAAYAALTAPNRTTWDGAAAALTPAILAVAQKGVGGIAAAAVPAGEVWFHYQYGLYAGGLAPLPGAVPPVYA